MRHLVNLIPLPRALAELVLIVGLFLAAIVVSRIAGRVAAWLVSRRAVQGEDAPADAVARLQQRETAASLTQTSVRYLAFGLALVLSIIVLSGVHDGLRLQTQRRLHAELVAQVDERPLGERDRFGGAVAVGARLRLDPVALEVREPGCVHRVGLAVRGGAAGGASRTARGFRATTGLL